MVIHKIMGRRNKQYFKSLHQQAYDKLIAMQAFGESKKEAMAEGTSKSKIFSFNTYNTYWKHIKYFLKWVQEMYPETTTLKAAKRHVNEWLHYRTEQLNDKGEKLSSWTIQTEEAALGKLFQIEASDPNRFQPPKRRRTDIKRSRIATERDAHFSESNNDELIRFCRGTGCRRGVLERLEGRDLWTRKQMEEEVERLQSSDRLTEKLEKHLHVLQDALNVFPNTDYFIHHRKDKGGRYRYAPIIGPDKDKIIKRIRETDRNARV